jgi:hypothetical protein
MVLWRVVFAVSSRRLGRDPFLVGPWHPDKRRVEQWSAWFAQRGQLNRIESNTSSGSVIS